MTPREICLSSSEWDALGPRLARQVVDGAHMTFTRYRFAPGGRFPRHVHDQEQITYVIRGRLTFVFPEGERALHQSTMIVIPPSVPHSAVAGPDGAEVVSIVSPPRDRADWDDAVKEAM